MLLWISRVVFKDGRVHRGREEDEGGEPWQMGGFRSS